MTDLWPPEDGAIAPKQAESRAEPQYSEAGIGSIPQAYLALSEVDRRSVREEVEGATFAVRV